MHISTRWQGFVNRGTQTQQSTNDFDVNGNLLALDNISTLHWHYNNTLNKLTKADKPNTIQYYVYDYQDKRVRTVTESNPPAESGLIHLANQGARYLAP
jgi:hypothetical protein